MLGGDFNIIRFSNERKGGCTTSRAMKDFSDWIRHHELVDLPLRGVKNTWFNKQEEPTMSRLDRFLVSTDWLDLFLNCLHIALSRPSSNYCPIALELDLDDWGPPPFRMEMMWLKENSFIEKVSKWRKEAPTEGWMGFPLAQKLKFLKKKINNWEKKTFGKVEERKNQLLDAIHHIDLKEETEGLDEQD